MTKMQVHVFGKSAGCSKCDALKRRVLRELANPRFADTFEMAFHDLLTEEGIVDFCRTNINPNSVPAMIIGIGDDYLPSQCTSQEWLEAGNLTRPYLGLVTEYNEHRGLITAEEIRGILQSALTICEE